MNTAKDQDAAVALKIDFEGLGIRVPANAVELVHGRPVDLRGGQIRLELKREEAAAVRLELQ